MKKLLLFLLINSFTQISKSIVLPNPPILPAPVINPAPITSPKLPTPAPIIPAVTPVVAPVNSLPRPLPSTTPIRPLVITPPSIPTLPKIAKTSFQPQKISVNPKAIATQATITTKTYLPSITIHNLSTQSAILKSATASINNKSTSIAIPSQTLISGKNLIPLYISSSLHTAQNFGGYTNININGNPISIIHPKTKANYFGSSTIYIDNINGQWKMVPQPKKDFPDDKEISNNKVSKQTLIKPVATVASNLQAKAKNSKSITGKQITQLTTKQSIVPPMPKEPKIVPIKQ